MDNTFELSKEETKKILIFAKDITKRKAQSSRDFGTSKRIVLDAIADTAEGKFAEVLFSHFIEQFGLKTDVDFDIYPDQMQIDFGQDLDSINSHTNRARVDIKASRYYSNWLLIEGHKFWSDAYIFIKIDLPRNFETDMDVMKKVIEGSIKISGSICGFAYYFDIVDNKTKLPWFKFKQGDSLYMIENIHRKDFASPVELKKWLDTHSMHKLNMRLKSPVNYGLPQAWLRNNEEDWKDFAQWIINSSINTNN